MGFTISIGDWREHFETREQVNDRLLLLNRGNMPMLIYTSPNGTEHYADFLRKIVTVTPDPPEIKEP